MSKAVISSRLYLQLVEMLGVSTDEFTLEVLQERGADNFDDDLMMMVVDEDILLPMLRNYYQQGRGVPTDVIDSGYLRLEGLAPSNGDIVLIQREHSQFTIKTYLAGEEVHKTSITAGTLFGAVDFLCQG